MLALDGPRVVFRHVTGSLTGSAPFVCLSFVEGGYHSGVHDIGGRLARRYVW